MIFLKEIGGIIMDGQDLLNNRILLENMIEQFEKKENGFEI